MQKKKFLLVLNMNGWDTVISFESQPFVILPKKNPRVWQLAYMCVNVSVMS